VWKKMLKEYEPPALDPATTVRRGSLVKLY
jgi:hypothetical protein